VDAISARFGLMLFIVFGTVNATCRSFSKLLALSVVQRVHSSSGAMALFVSKYHFRGISELKSQWNNKALVERLCVEVVKALQKQC